MKNCKLFQGITQEEIDKMMTCAKARVIELGKDEYVFRQGDVPQNMYLLLEGSVMIAKDYLSGKRNVLFLVYAKDVLGEMFLFSDEKQYWYDAITNEKCRLLEIPWKFFYGFCHNACGKHQLIVKNMLEIQSGKNFMMTKKLYLLSGKTLRERISMWILDQAGAGDRVLLDMNREELADYLGTTRPSLSRELMNMQEDGLIDVSRSRILINDREELEQYSR